MSDARPLSDATRVAIIASAFNHHVTTPLKDGAIRALKAAGFTDARIDVLEVPGAYELPLAAKWLAQQGRVDAIIALGAVIRGATAHFDYVAGACTDGLMQVQMEHALPVSMGVLTTENLEQAMERADPGRMNKGHEVATAALEMLALRAQLEDS